MEIMRRVAFETVFRACGFGALAIFCVMIGMSFNARLAFQTGGILTLMMVVILLLKAYGAQKKDYRRTEMWLYLTEEQRPPAAYAQWASATVLRETYFMFARWTSMIAIAMLVIALLFSLAGR
jgi:type IV secretory pathway VirB3-like protein